MQAPDSDSGVDSLDMTHAGYLKLFQLGRKLLGRSYDVIMLDEAQDSNPCIANIVLRETGCARIMVGDSHQVPCCYSPCFLFARRQFPPECWQKLIDAERGVRPDFRPNFSSNPPIAKTREVSWLFLRRFPFCCCTWLYRASCFTVLCSTPTHRPTHAAWCHVVLFFVTLLEQRRSMASSGQRITSEASRGEKFGI